MKRRIMSSDGHASRIESGWWMALSEADAVAEPSDLGVLKDWIQAKVPGTAAGALAAAGQFNAEDPTPLHDKDTWFIAGIREDEPGERLLVFEGLATIAEVWWNGEKILDSDSMFLGHEVRVTAREDNALAICFRALAPHLAAKGPRARWRPQLAVSQGLRLVRTTLLGHMPGWCPEVHAVGPWRPVSLLKPDAPSVRIDTMTATLENDGTGVLSLAFSLDNAPGVPIIRCAGESAEATRGDDGSWRAELRIADVAAWWPHTHGDPALHAIYVDAGGESFSLGKAGFRRIEVERGADGEGFALTVNGTPVFCRGAVWTNADIVNLPGDAESYRPWLDLAADAGMNMLRVGGTMVYESPDFFALCDELGLMVWQDFQFANYDYPVGDDAFAGAVRDEARHFLGATMGSPSLAVLCGGSEIYQQGAMLGLPESKWRGPLTEEILPEICAELRPDAVYAANSPDGGALPFSPDAGIAHYYGVGAYRRPLDDARRANVRFAGECLAFSHVPQQRTLDAHLPVMPCHDPRWKARVPRDRGAGWDFEDVRDHYFKLIYGLDPIEVRYGDPARYLDMSRAVTGEVMEAVYAEWRRAASPCQGALLFTYQDLLPGAGWGVVDSTGEPKPAWYALKRAFRPLQVALTDEGTNGLAVHVVNETATARDVELTIDSLRDGATRVVGGERTLTLAPREVLEIPATDLFGAFFDTTNAYRFGPPAHDVTVARLRDPDSHVVLADAFHFPAGYPAARVPLAIEASAERDERGNWWLALSTDRFAQSVHVDDANFRPTDDWFHLAPGANRHVRLIRRADAAESAVPAGTVAALNGTRGFGFGG
ncbi:glycosyl hydrolase 2 galactose-binding domain-containing protein [Oricola indica]|uniref:glycosyl hydrolase 2 galactose-binding domain-containing protein n=1 Tax=Oricola indica TaxID=2872591 RepID=UPI003CCBC1F1